MPTRVERHKQGSREYRATLYFIRAEPRHLNGFMASAFVAKAVEIAVSDSADRYTHFLAELEDTLPAGEARQSLPHRTYALAGDIAFIPIQMPIAVGRRKLLDAAAHKRTKGHVSYRPQRFLYQDTCAFIMGSPGFLVEHADLYLERSGALREKFIDFVKVLLRIKDCSQATRLEDSMIQVNLWEKAFYPGNFDALAELAFKTRMTTEEVLRGRLWGIAQTP